jgi:hypothetical protein
MTEIKLDKRLLTIVLVAYLLMITFDYFLDLDIVCLADIDDYYIDIELESNYDFIGGWLNFTLYTNFNKVNITITNGVDSYTFYNKQNGFERNIRLIDIDYGYYEIIGERPFFKVVKYFTVVNNMNLHKTVFPLNATHKNINYNLYSNGSLKAEINGNNFILDFGWLKDFAKKESTSKTVKNNNMMIVGSWINEETGYICNITFIKVYQGLKLLIYLDTPEVIFFDYDLKEGRDILAGYKKDSIVFDYRDLIKSFKKYMTINKRQNKIIIILPSGEYFLDPIIFADGFETGDSSQWDNTFTGNGGIATVMNINPLFDTFSFKGNDTDGTGWAYVEKQETASELTYVNITGYFRIQNCSFFDIGDYIDFFYVRNIGDGIFRSMFYYSVDYNTTQNKPVISRYLNGTTLNEIDSNYVIEQLKIYNFMFLSNYTSDRHLFYMNNTLVFNDTGFYSLDTNKNLYRHDYLRFGLTQSGKDAGETACIYVDNFEVNNNPWIFEAYIYFRVYDFISNPLSDVNVTLYNLTSNIKLDSGITDINGLIVFNHVYPTDKYGCVIFENVIGKYANFSLRQNINNNITKYVMPYDYNVSGNSLLAMFCIVPALLLLLAIASDEI